MAEKEKINPVTLDIVKDSLIAVSNEIFYAFAQTSMSPIIYETLDYASGIADAEGRLLTQGNGVTGFIGMISPMICAVVEKHGKENLHPGDVYIINDPFMGGGTHMSDVGTVSYTHLDVYKRQTLLRLLCQIFLPVYGSALIIIIGMLYQKPAFLCLNRIGHFPNCQCPGCIQHQWFLSVSLIAASHTGFNRS